MKNIFRNIAIASAVVAGFATTSCEDMMTIDTGDKAYVNAQDTLYSYLGIMRAMQDVAERQVILGEIRGDLVSSTDYTTDTLFAISNFDNPQDMSCSMLQASDYYNVINNCNFYIHNADTSAVKANIQYMLPEYIQVKAIRAWAYLQLVKNYKEVPYITEPISSLSVIENFDYANNMVNKDNLVDKVLEDGLLEYPDYIDRNNYPQYGSASDPLGKFNNGSVSIHARMMMIPIRVLLGDMYLLRGASQSDYEAAALSYYTYLRSSETTPLYARYCSASESRTGTIMYSTSGANSWGYWASTYTFDPSTNEVISIIPSSANAGFGKMLTRVADIFGYTPSSSQSIDDNSSDDADDASSSASGNISVTRNYKRQYGPSSAYQNVVKAQTYVNYKVTGNTVESTPTYINNCDARYGLSVENLTYEGEAYPLCSKAASGGTFYYSIPIYRKALVWLRLAEAINRAGYPKFAFAILKDGINQYTLPKVVSQIHVNEEGDTTHVKVLEPGSNGAMYYFSAADSTQIEKFTNGSFMNFKDDVWNSTYGIHARGAGFGNMPSENGIQTCITGYFDSIYYDYSRLLLEQGVDIGTASSNEIINAMENIIVDELALETAFEGNRFTDLVRIAEHKTASGFDGVDWLAKKIASRNSQPTTDSSSEVLDGTLYAKLKNTNLWYFELPKSY